MDRQHLDSLFASQYDALRVVARRALARGRRSGVVRPTELVHECYLKLSRSNGLADLPRAEFLSLAATAIRTLLVDHARRRSALKRGAGHRRITLQADLLDRREPLDLTELNDALTKLAGLDERMARVVELRLFGGLPVDEIARLLGVAPRTVDNDWAMAKAWLHREIG